MPWTRKLDEQEADVLARVADVMVDEGRARKDRKTGEDMAWMDWERAGVRVRLKVLRNASDEPVTSMTTFYRRFNGNGWQARITNFKWHDMDVFFLSPAVEERFRRDLAILRLTFE